MERAQRRYSPELKQRIVEDVEAGHLSLREAAREVQTSLTMIQKWMEEFGRYKPKRDIVEVVMKSEQERIAALEKALAEAHLKLQVYDALIVQANKHYKTDLKKSFGTGPRGPAAPSAGTAGSPSAPSVPSSAARGTRTTSASSGPASPRAAGPARPKR
jgi:transposase-like protein